MKYKKLLPILFLTLISCNEKISEKDQLNIEKQAIIDSISAVASSQIFVNVDNAISEYTKILEIEKNNLDALGNRATLLMQNGRYHKAIIDYTDIININEENKDFNNTRDKYLLRGICKYNLRDYLGALRDFDQVEKLLYDVDDLYIYRAYSFLKIGDLNNACLNFSKAGERGYTEAYEEINKYCK